ncbi:MAG TPA: hypothetical protein VFC19_24785 [Candidatus Limnocylindrales bacterium]|nr:hypothetical protein [Candidatus Limnocylindrales bacterium]
MRRPILLLPVVLAAGLMLPGPASAGVSDPVDPAAPMGVASWGVNRLDLFAKGTDGTLKHKIYNGRWSGWESLGGSITSGPSAVSWGPGRLDVVARGVNGDVQHIGYFNGNWGVWGSLGGGIVGEPSITSWGDHHLDIYVRGTNNATYHKAYTGSWQASWTSIGGTASSSPAAVAWASGRMDVFVRGGGNSIYHRWFTGGKWSTAWENLGGTLSSAPAAFSWRSGHLDVYARNTSNGISHKGFSSGWSGWLSIGGTVATAPTVVDWGSSRVDVFARGIDQTLQHATYSGSWQGWRTETDAAPTLPVRQYSRTVAMQASPPSGALIGPIEYGYVDNIGRIVSGHQPDPANANSVQWTVISGNEAFTGPPGLVEQPDKRLQVNAMHTRGDVRARAQTTAGASTWTSWLNQGGGMASPVTVARQTDTNVILLAVDASGGLWYLRQSNVGGPYETWRSLGAIGLKDAPTVVTGQDGLQLFGVNTSGAVVTATLFPAGTVSAWTNLGSIGATNAPAAVVYPGYRMRVFAQAADGTIVTKMQDATLAWPAAWTVVGTQVAAGAPAAVLSPLSGKTEILMRGNDGNIYSTGETMQGSGVWREWVAVLQGSDIAATDPTVLTYNDGFGLRWAFLFRTPDQQSRLYTVDTVTAASATYASSDQKPLFRAQNLPAPPSA